MKNSSSVVLMDLSYPAWRLLMNHFWVDPTFRYYFVPRLFACALTTLHSPALSCSLSLSLSLYCHVLTPIPRCVNIASHVAYTRAHLHDKLEQPWSASPWILGSELSSRV